MSIAVLTSNETGANSLADINANFADLDTTKADLASPNFTGNPVFPTPFTVGATSVTTTGTELNYVAGTTSSLQSQIDSKAPINSPTLVTPTLGVATATSINGIGIAGTSGKTITTTDNTTLANAAITLGNGKVISLLENLTIPVDPNADSILFWDDSAAASTWLSIGSGLAITDTTISATGSGTGITWSEVTGTTQSAAVNSGYITNNVAMVTVTIPTTAAVGDIVEIVGKGAGLWTVAQNASEIIHFGDLNTTTGTGGSLVSTHRRDCIRLICVVANTEWSVMSSQGNITIV